MRQFKQVYVENGYYFVTTPTEGRRPVFSDDHLARVVVDNLKFYARRGDFSLLSYVVMPDHLHAILVPRVGSISDAMRNVKSFVAKEVREVTGHRGPLWQSSSYDRMIRGDADFLATIEDIHYNPVEAELVGSTLEYPFSSADWYEAGCPDGWGMGVPED